MKHEQVTAAELNRKAIPACSKCGSQNVRAECFAEWNRVKQDWQVADILDGNSVCADCGMDCTIKWKLTT